MKKRVGKKMYSTLCFFHKASMFSNVLRCNKKALCYSACSTLISYLLNTFWRKSEALKIISTASCFSIKKQTCGYVITIDEYIARPHSKDTGISIFRVCFVNLSELFKQSK